MGKADERVDCRIVMPKHLPHDDTRYILLNELARQLGRDKSNFNKVARRSGLTIHKVRANETDNQEANAIAMTDIPAFFAFLDTLGYGKAGRVVGSDAVKSLVEAWRKA